MNVLGGSGGALIGGREGRFLGLVRGISLKLRMDREGLSGEVLQSVTACLRVSSLAIVALLDWLC